MAVTFYSVKCPDCDASLSIEVGRDRYFCPYCGAKVISANDNEYVFRRIDEAEVAQAEVDKLIKLKRMELIEKQMNEESRRRKVRTVVSILLGFFGILFIAIGYSGEQSGLTMAGLFCLLILFYMWLFRDVSPSRKD